MKKSILTLIVIVAVAAGSCAYNPQSKKACIDLKTQVICP